MRQIEAQLPKGFTLPEPPGYGNLDITQLRNSKYFFA
jgi:DNA-directed RNA polymerase